MNKILTYIKSNKKELLFVFLISLAALIIRINSLLSSGDLWIDELYSYYFASKNSLSEVIKALYIEDLHTPFYFILLHFWIKLFGNGETVMRLLTFIPAFLMVPISFYICKYIFNRKTGYIASLIFTLSPFLIYYTTELRFYGLLPLLSLFSAYFFTKILSDGVSKKNTIGLTVTNLLILYTFNVSFIYVIIQFLVGILYKFKKSVDIKNILKIYLLTLVLYLPAFLMTIHGIFAYRNSICNFAGDIFTYNAGFIFILLQSYFTGNFYYANLNNFTYNSLILKNIMTPQMFFLILLPILASVGALLKAIFSKNKLLVPFLVPAFCFLLFELIAAQSGKMSLIARYTIVSFPIIICTLSYGITLFKNKFLKFLICFFICFSMLTFIALKENNPIKKEVYLGSPVREKLLSDIKITKNDYVFAPVMGKLYKKYIPYGKYIDFEATDMFLNGSVKYYPLVFDNETIYKLTRKNAKELLKPYIFGQKEGRLKQYLHDSYFINMEKGQRFIFIVNNINTINNMQLIFDKPEKEKEKLYKINSLYYLAVARIVKNALDVSNDNLMLTKTIIINDKRKTDNNTGIFVFEKI